jgi:hypothetical protein
LATSIRKARDVVRDAGPAPFVVATVLTSNKDAVTSAWWCLLSLMMTTKEGQEHSCKASTQDVREPILVAGKAKHQTKGHWQACFGRIQYREEACIYLRWRCLVRSFGPLALHLPQLSLSISSSSRILEPEHRWIATLHVASLLSWISCQHGCLACGRVQTSLSR